MKPKYRRASKKDDAYEIIRLYYSETGRVIRQPLEHDLVDYPSVVATQNGKIVGFAYTLPFAPDILRLENLFVHSEHRNDGIGANLMHHLEHFTKENYCEYKFMILDNSLRYPYFKENTPKRSAKNFYERIGYEVIMETADTTVLKKELSPVKTNTACIH